MRAIASVLVIVAVIVILIIDGLGMYAGHRMAVEVAQAAADKAAQAFVSTNGSERVAEQVVQSIATEADVDLISVSFHKGHTRWTQVTVRAMPDTHVLAHFPGVKELLWQESTAVAHF